MKVIKRELKYPPIEDSNEVCYMILNVGIPKIINTRDCTECLKSMESAIIAGSQLGIELSSIILKWGESILPDRYIFNFPEFNRNDEEAQIIGETFLYALSYYHGPSTDAYSPAVFRIPSHMINKKKIIDGDMLIQLATRGCAHPPCANKNEVPLWPRGSIVNEDRRLRVC